MKKIFFTLVLSIAFASCTTELYYSKNVKNWKEKLPPESSGITHTVYLIGDGGDPSLSEIEPNFRVLRNHILKDSNSSLVFLGDNIYLKGLPELDEGNRAEAEKKLLEQVKIFDNYKGKVFFIAGNHDWEYQGPGGLRAVMREEAFLEEVTKRGNIFIPDNGCAGPFKVVMGKRVVMIAIDSQWFLHEYEKPQGRGFDCPAEDAEDFVTQLKDILETNKNNNILIVAHHPLISNGNHGGFYSVLDHIFPLRLIRKNWYLPLPVIGSIYPLYRKFGGTNQDIPSYKYQQFIDMMKDALDGHDNVIYAAGHDHNLQLHKLDNINHIVSGSGSRLNPVTGGDGAAFVQHEKGFSKVVYYKNGEAWVEYWVPKDDKLEGRLSFRTKLYSRKESGPELFCGLSKYNYEDSMVVAKACDNFDISGMGETLLGDHYREAWGTPVKVPLLDLKTEKGGLIPYAIGGRKQSLSLKLKDMDDHEYQVRSIRKDPTKAVPVDFRNTVIHDLVRDQISAQHPYGALVVSPLADAASVFHTNPKLVLIPNDSCLGPYQERFSNMLGIFEEDPDESHENVASLGYSKNIIGTDKLKVELEEDNDNRIDQYSFLRARLFDMLLGDWDRHEKQYRWASFETDKGATYKAVPEDRDQVFFNFDGVIPWLVSRRWGVRNLQNFEDDFDDIIGLNLSAKNLDRRFATGLSRQEWVAMADSLKRQLTDEVIENSVRAWPEPIQNLHAKEIIAKLKSRRDKLPQIAEKYYEILSKYVDVYGSKKHEKFQIERLNDNETRVTVYKMKKEGELKKIIFQRVFLRNETKEIRLYGMGGNDLFDVTGNVDKGILLRIIGGRGNDTVIAPSKVSGIDRKTYVYDTKEGNVLNLSRDVNEELSDNEEINETSLDEFQYNYLGPLVSLLFNQDDGLFIGAGLLYKKYKFRSIPFGQTHKFTASISAMTGAKVLRYRGFAKRFISGADLGVNADYFGSSYIMNFFGLGNETQFVKPIDSVNFYRVRLNYININPFISKAIRKFFTVGIGPKYESFELMKPTQNSFLTETFSEERREELYQTRHYAGLRAFFRLGTVDNIINPTRGLLFTAEGNLNKGVAGASNFYQQYLSEYTFYITPNLPFQLTFAGRVGGGINFGDYEFFQANALGGGNILGIEPNLRGFRKTRFIGDKSFYQNAEVRAEVLRFNVYLFPAKVGLIGLVDNGRVWVRNEKSDDWHTGVGGGAWINIYNKIIISGTYTISPEDRLVNFRTGFFF